MFSKPAVWSLSRVACFAVLLAPIYAADSTKQPRDLAGSAHVAYIPADADLNSIHFEKIRLAEVPTAQTSTFDTGYCEDMAFRDPGGSLYCPYTSTGSPVKTYVVTYSYLGAPLASDERGDRHFTFQVYFRPGELTPEMRDKIAAPKRDRSATAELFAVSTRRDLVHERVVDNAHSRYCEGTFVDGSSVQSNPACNDQITYINSTHSANFITVTVDAGVRTAGKL